MGGGGSPDESFEGAEDFLEGGGESLSDPFLGFLVTGAGLGLELFFSDFLDEDGDDSGAVADDFARLLRDGELTRCSADPMTLKCKELGCLVDK